MEEEVLAAWGARRLAAAMLVRAALDIHSVTKGRDVISWMRNPSEAEFSFVFCCRLVGRDPRQIRSSLEHQADWLVQRARPGIVCPRPASRAASSAATMREHAIRRSPERLAS